MQCRSLHSYPHSGLSRLFPAARAVEMLSLIRVAVISSGDPAGLGNAVAATLGLSPSDSPFAACQTPSHFLSASSCPFKINAKPKGVKQTTL